MTAPGPQPLAISLNGGQLGLVWVIPFIGLLLSIAVLPMAAPRLWQRHFGKIASLWSLILLLPCALRFGTAVAAAEAIHALLVEYLPFVILLFALFVIAGGIRVKSDVIGTPQVNVVILALGTLLASVLGTTGASMLLIRPLIGANHHRHHKTHVFVFFIFLVSNIGGSLTPLGDPPLFLGFLNGVDFSWPAAAMLAPMLIASLVLLALFYALDRRAWRQDRFAVPARPPHEAQIRVQGLHNLLYLGLVVAAVFATGVWHNSRSLPLGWGLHVPAKGAVRDLLLLALTLLSWKTTPRQVRIKNAFTWHPIQEVAALFAGLFVTMAPAIAILRAGRSGALAPLIEAMSGSDGHPIDAAYFWVAGLLSSFLDNAPTYLVFFNLAGGNAQRLMGEYASTLLAISAGAVFMGANTYIGNAPNFMVRSICEERGVKMPGFFGYMLWSGAILLPLFACLSWLFFA